MTILRSKLGIALILLISAFAFLYFFTGAFGGTFIGLTLNSNKSLQEGLVAHYTFDSTDVSGSSISDDAGANDGTLYIDATTTEVIIGDASTNQSTHQGSSHPIVWINSQEGFILYRDNSGANLDVATTSDGGETWVQQATVIPNTTYSGAVWYDGWTEGDSGTKVHIVAPNESVPSATENQNWYNTFDMVTGVAGTATTTLATTTVNLGSANVTTITKSRDGTLYTTILDDDTWWVERCSSACDETASWTEFDNPYDDNGDTASVNHIPIFIPVPGTDNVMLIWWTASSRDVESNIWSATSSSWWGWDTSFEQASQEDYGGYIGLLSATPNYANGNIYLATPDDINLDSNADHDIEFYEWDGDTYTWTRKTDCVTDAIAITMFKIALDERTGDIYCIFIALDDPLDFDTSNVYFKNTQDNGVTWSATSGPVNILEDRLWGAYTSAMSDSRISVAWFDSINDQMHHYTVALLDESYEGKPVPGNIGQGMEFDGVDDEVVISSFDPAHQGTVAYWVWADSVANQRVLGGDDDFEARILGEEMLHDFFGNDGGTNVPLSVGNWIHIVNTYDFAGDAEMRTYKDGEFLGSSADAIKDPGGPFDITLGFSTGYSGSDGHLDGKLDDVRIYDRVLTDAEVSRLYGLGATTKIAKTLDTNPDLENGLVGHWTFDGYPDTNFASNTAEILDMSGNGNNGDWVDHSTTTKPGVLGQALDFSGVGDYVNVATIDDSNYGNNTFSASFWGYMFLNQEDANAGCMGARVSGVGWRVYVNDASDTWRASIDDGPTEVNSTKNIVHVNEWAHVVYIIDRENDTAELYINGILYDSDDISAVGDISSSVNLEIGGAANGTYCDALLDDVRFYTKALSQKEIQRLYQLGATTKVSKTINTNPDLENGLVGHWTFDGSDLWDNATDRSGNGNNGFLQNFSSTTTRPGAVGQALEFDGVDDEITTSFGGPSSATEYSISAWVKSDVPDDSKVVAGWWDGADGIWIQTKTSGEGFLVLAGTGSTYGQVTVDIEDWYHVTLVYNGNLSGNASRLKLYYNGVEQTLSFTGTIPAILGTFGSNFGIGDIGNLERQWDGLIDEVRTYDRALSADEVFRLYQLGQ